MTLLYQGIKNAFRGGGQLVSIQMVTWTLCPQAFRCQVQPIGWPRKWRRDCFGLFNPRWLHTDLQTTQRRDRRKPHASQATYMYASYKQTEMAKAGEDYIFKQVTSDILQW